MIGMVVGDEDIGEGPALLLKGREDRVRLGRIDGRRGPRLGIVEQDAVIVAPGRKLIDLELGHHALFFCLFR